MKKRVLLLLLPVAIYAEDLKSLIDYALNNNNIIKAKSLTEQAKQKDLESIQNSYYPTVDVGGYYQRLDSRSPNTPGDIVSGYAKIGFDIYDSDKKSNLIKQNEALLEYSKYDSKLYENSLQISIANDFYNIKSAEESLVALEDKQVQLQAELDRIKKFFEVGSATKDEIDKLQAAYSNNTYQIDEAKYQILALKKLFSLKLGKDITSLEYSNIQEPKELATNTSFDIKMLEASSSSLLYAANALEAAYNPQVRLEDTYSLYGYGRDDVTHPEGLDNQNKLMLTLSLRLFDNGVVSKQKESLLVQKMSLSKQIEQLKLTQDINVELAMHRIKTSKAQIASAKNSLEAATSAYETIVKKYQVGVLDNVAYLDALSVKTEAKAQYEKSLNDLQIAYASFYYYSNQNITEFIK